MNLQENKQQKLTFPFEETAGEIDRRKNDELLNLMFNDKRLIGKQKQKKYFKNKRK